MSDMYANLPMLNCSLENSVLSLSLNNPDMRNALVEDVIESLVKNLARADQDSNVRVVILKGEGKSFCAGGDIKAMRDNSGMFAGESFELKNRYHFGIQEIPRAIEKFQKPIIAQVHGAAIGAGCDLVAMCDLRFASEECKFGETFTKLSLVPGDGGPFFLTRAIGYTKAMEMYLTADLYSAHDMKDYGLLNNVFKSDELGEQVAKVALRIARNAPGAIQLTKEALKQSATSSLDQHLQLMSAFQGVAQRMTDHQRGIEAVLNKKEPTFEGN